MTQAKETEQKRTLGEAVEVFSPVARGELIPLFESASVAYPPEKLTLLAIKGQHILEAWAFDKQNQPRFIKRYFIWGASGGPGPKLTEGDKQVPEGIYQIVGLNPGSKFHLSLELNYPNEFDRKWALAERRADPGGNIFIHGKSSSVGCLAMGDKNIEELFILAYDTGLSNIEVVIAPEDPRVRPLELHEDAKPWVYTLYRQIEDTFRPFRK
ncbi:L,D-transpeptidase family protein [Vibrio sp. JC009]|uniref:L,D-transpeptidase family protein n=1 Tax=Vibrio sp. JC009 TaxID=2912314 RepID=UPI0023B01EB9|nr:L,D-transpeptidase family protein [Vibrio sp. JC009]WED24873.1 L,D-transpeptidase family protein [Vibrio sp. JC009]